MPVPDGHELASINGEDMDSGKANVIVQHSRDGNFGAAVVNSRRARFPWLDGPGQVHKSSTIESQNLPKSKYNRRSNVRRRNYPDNPPPTILKKVRTKRQCDDDCLKDKGDHPGTSADPYQSSEVVKEDEKFQIFVPGERVDTYYLVEYLSQSHK